MQAVEKKTAQTFRKADRDGNGELALKELARAARISDMSRNRFLARHDENDDGIVARGEQERTLQERKGLTPEKQFKAFDRNKDGKLSGKETRDGKFAQSLGVKPREAVTRQQFVDTRNDQKLRAQFSDYDRDKNGLLEGKEIQSRVLGAKDIDLNKGIDLEEWLGIKKLPTPPEPEPSEPEIFADPELEPEVFEEEVFPELPP
ncbi:MAG: hypothetical protein VKP72_00940, partial [bacterium]|nr:hypothetical protein [bacterium]